MHSLVGTAHFFCFYLSNTALNVLFMSHPLIPQILEIAEAIATSLDLEVVDVIMHTHKNPATVRVDIRNKTQHTGLEDCERMSKALEVALDEADVVPYVYVLEVSSPGTDREIKTDREFLAFRGFMVKAIAASETWIGQLVSCDLEKLTINQKGRIVHIPRQIVTKVELAD
jgi:ribosome maturation factor RimP